MTHPRQSQMTLAEAHAGEEWSSAFERFVRGWRQGDFTGEEITRHAKPVIGEPATDKAWGSAISRFARRGIIERVGVGKRWNGNLTPVWRLK